MKPKTKAFADALAADPKLSQTDAYLMTHETQTRTTAAQNASQLLRKPTVQLYLEKHRDLARKTQVNILQKANKKQDDLAWQTLASNVAEKVLDRTDGKPLTTTNNLNININVEEALNSLI